MGWGDVMALPILLDWAISSIGYNYGIAWLIISGILTIIVTKGMKVEKTPFLPIMWVAYVLLKIALFLFSG